MASAVIGALRVVLSADSAAFTSGLKQAEGKLNDFTNKMPSATKAIAALGVAVTAVAASVVAGMKKTLDEADKLVKAAQSMGVPVEELSKIKHAADLAGVGLESLQTSMVRLARAMSETATGATSDAVKAFEVLGISVKDADGNMKSSSAVLSEIAGKFAAYEDGVNKTALAVAIFGRAGASMIPLLNGGATGLADAAREAERFGIVIDTVTGKAAEQFNDNMTRLGRVLDGIFMEALVKVAPELERLSTIFVNAAVQGKDFAGTGDLVAAAMRGAAEFVARFNGELAGTGATFRGLKEAMDAVLTGDFTGAGTALARMRDEVSRIKRETAGLVAVIQGNTGPFGTLNTDFKPMPTAADKSPKPSAPGLPSKADTSSGGGGGGSKDTSVEDEMKREREKIMRKLEVLREGFLSEQELLVEEYEKNRNIIDGAYQINMENLKLNNEEKLALAQQHNEMMTKLEEEHQKKLNEIRSKGMYTGLSLVAKGGKDMANAFGDSSKKMAAVAKTFGAVEALINAYRAFNQTLADPTLPWFAKIGAAASVLAAGISTVMSIKGISDSGGGGGGAKASGGGGSASAPSGAAASSEGAQKAIYLTMNGTSFGRDQVRELIESINDYSNDGGVKLVMAR